MNIGIVAWSLFETRGGIERNACNLAEAMIRRGHTVTILYQEPSLPKARPVYTPPPEAALVGLRLDYGTVDLEPARRRIAEANLDALVAMFSWESLLWFPALVKGTNTRLIISEHSNPELINAKWNAYERHCCLYAADHIRILLKEFVQAYPEPLHGRITVIPNPAYLDSVPAVRPARKERYTLLGAGRFLEKVKQFSLLIKAFSLLSKAHPQWDLELCGDGPAFAEYKELLTELGLESRTRMPGMVRDLSSHYAAADIFCIPSLNEGFGMVTIEAQHYGLPVVGFAACTGVNSIIVHGKNGLLAEEMTPESLAASLDALMRDHSLRRSLGDQGKNMLERFAPRKVFDAWEELLWSTVRATGPTRIQRIMENPASTDPGHLAAQELLNRVHPFDRSRYLRLHAHAARSGSQSPFSERVVKGFKKKQARFCFPGYRTPLNLARMLLRRIRYALLSLVTAKECRRG